MILHNETQKFGEFSFLKKKKKVKFFISWGSDSKKCVTCPARHGKEMYKLTDKQIGQSIQILLFLFVCVEGGLTSLEMDVTT